MPPRNNSTSSHSAVPCKKLLQKNSMNATAATNAADPHARTVQLDVNAHKSNHQQQHGQPGRRQRLDQLQRPIRLGTWISPSKP